MNVQSARVNLEAENVPPAGSSLCLRLRETQLICFNVYTNRCKELLHTHTRTIRLLHGTLRPSRRFLLLQELGLIGLRIQRMATDPGREFNNPAAYTYLTVASPSCHDVTPLRAW